MELTTEEFNTLMEHIVCSAGINHISETHDDIIYLFMEEGWCLFWEEKQVESVHISFHQEIDPNDAAKMTMAYERLLAGLDIELIVCEAVFTGDSMATMATGETIH